MSKANLAGHDFEGPVGSVGSFRSLKKAPASRPVPSRADRLVYSHQLDHRWGKVLQTSR